MGFYKSHQRLLTVNGKYVIWKMWADAKHWDQLNTFKTHHRLTNEHIFPNGAQKIRNKLAYECLKDAMLNPDPHDTVFFNFAISWAGGPGSSD